MLANPKRTKDEIVQWIREYFAANGNDCCAVKRKSREPQRLQAIGNLHDVAKQILDDEVVILLRQYGTTLAPGRMGDESRVPKWLLVLAADRIEELKNARTKQ